MYRAGYPRVTHPSAALSEEIARLACVRHAASVHPEPGSNSQNKISLLYPLRCYLKISGMVCMAFELFVRTKYICCSVFKVHLKLSFYFLFSCPLSRTSIIISAFTFNVNTFFKLFLFFIFPLDFKSLSNAFKILLLSDYEAFFNSNKIFIKKSAVKSTTLKLFNLFYFAIGKNVST